MNEIQNAARYLSSLLRRASRYAPSPHSVHEESGILTYNGSVMLDERREYRYFGLPRKVEFVVGNGNIVRPEEVKNFESMNGR